MPSQDSVPTRIIAVIGPTASGKTARAIALALELHGEVISVDSRQVYRTLDIGTEKTTADEMQGIPHHLIDIRDPDEQYSAANFVHDATELITDISARGKVPILAGGTHFYFDALLYGLPHGEPNTALRAELEMLSTTELMERLSASDPIRAASIDPYNRRRIIRALEIISQHGHVPVRTEKTSAFDVEWHIVDHPKEVLRERIDARLTQALERGLIEEVTRTQERVGIGRLNELGLEYRVVGEFVRGERTETSLLPTLSSSLWRYARHQKAWLARLSGNEHIAA